jgi:hypothetical protein
MLLRNKILMAAGAPSQRKYINAILNGDFLDGTSGFTAGYSVNSANDGILSNTSTGGGMARLASSELSALSGDKIYGYARFRVLGADCSYVEMRAYTSKWHYFFTINSLIQNQWYEGSGIIVVPSTLNPGAALFHSYPDSPAGRVMEVDKVIVYNLTNNGLGDKDLAWCDANIPPNIIW